MLATKEPVGRAPRLPAARFWEKVRVANAADPASCWEWSGYRTPDGYGRFMAKKGAAVAAHRFAYELIIGPIPEGLHLDHLCRVRHCVNPDHLDPVTLEENTRRGQSYWAAKTHCPQGHAYDEANTYINRNGHRQCRHCNRDRMRRAYQPRG